MPEQNTQPDLWQDLLNETFGENEEGPQNIPENSSPPDPWQDLLNETFGSLDDVPQTSLADNPQEPESPAEPVEVKPAEPEKKVRKFYKKPVFWISCTVATILIALLIAIAPTLLAFGMWPQLKECKVALDQWQKLDCYRLKSNTYSETGNKSDMLITDVFISINTTEISRCGNDWLHLVNTREDGVHISNIVLCKDGKFYSQSYNSAEDDKHALLEASPPHLFQKPLPMSFSWYGKQLQIKNATYTNSQQRSSATVSVADFWGRPQYDLTFNFREDGSLLSLVHVPADNNEYAFTTYTVVSSEQTEVQKDIDSYYNLYVSQDA